MTRCVSVPGLVSKPPDERQTPASGDDLASPCRPGLLHLHDEPCGSHRQPALPFPITPAAALLLPPGRWSWFGIRGRPVFQPPALSREFPDAVSSIPEAGAAVRLQTSVPVSQSDSRPRSRRESLLLPGLSFQPIQRPLSATAQFGLRLFPNEQD